VKWYVVLVKKISQRCIVEVDTNPFRYIFYFSTFTMISLIDSNSICNPRVAMTEANTTIPCKHVL